jgi:hypothetical protein
MENFDFGQRYDAKRNAGISEYRTDGSRTSRNTDIEAGAAEQFVADFFGKEVNREIYARHGDRGVDFKIDAYTVDVVHLGVLDDGSPRLRGNLLINPHEPWRHADMYIVVRGTTSSGFTIIGWTGHDNLIERQPKDFGFGPRYWMPIGELTNIKVLVEAINAD